MKPRLLSRKHIDAKAFLKEHLHDIRGDYEALMLFGSYARGDTTENSDIDILQLTKAKRRAYRHGLANVSAYTPESLSYLARHGSLFVLHLQQDGVFLEDRRGRLKEIINTYKRPANYDYFRAQLRAAAPLLDCTDEFYFKYWQPLHAILVFLLRSTCFAECAEKGNPLFSMKAVACVLADDRIECVSKIKYLKVPDRPLFKRGVLLLSDYLRTEILNPFQSVEAFLFERRDQSKLLRALSKRFEMVDSSEDFYNAESQKPEDLVCPLP